MLQTRAKKKASKRKPKPLPGPPAKKLMVEKVILILSKNVRLSIKLKWIRRAATNQNQNDCGQRWNISRAAPGNPNDRKDLTHNRLLGYLCEYEMSDMKCDTKLLNLIFYTSFNIM